MDIKKAPIMRDFNYILIPVTKTDNPSEFNKVLMKYNKRNYKWLERTKSGGISCKGFRGAGIYLSATVWGAELIVIDYEGMFRLQFRNKIFEKEDNIDEDKLKITGKQALVKFYDELKKININLNDYAIENGEDVKKTIEKPLIGFANNKYKDIELENVHHIDINSSYPAGVKEYHPEFAPVIDKWYELKKQGHKEYKAYLNLMIGTMQSKFVHYRYADMSKYAIARNNEKIKNASKWLEDNGRKVILYNTDGIWFQGEPYPTNSENLGEFKQDHTNCKFRAKSGGAYEFIENGKYYPVLRGRTKLDEIMHRNDWSWGDIYLNDAENVKKYKLTFEKGLEVIYEKLG